MLVALKIYFYFTFVNITQSHAISFGVTDSPILHKVWSAVGTFQTQPMPCSSRFKAKILTFVYLYVYTNTYQIIVVWWSIKWSVILHQSFLETFRFYVTHCSACISFWTVLVNQRKLMRIEVNTLFIMSDCLRRSKAFSGAPLPGGAPVLSSGVRAGGVWRLPSP